MEDPSLRNSPISCMNSFFINLWIMRHRAGSYSSELGVLIHLRKNTATLKENFFHKAEKFSCSCKIVVSGEKISVPVKMLELQVGVKILICGHFVQPCVYHSSQNPKIFSDVKNFLLRVWKIFCG